MQSSTLYIFSTSVSGHALLATRIHVLLFVLALPDVSHAAKGPQLSNPPANACTVALFPFPPLLEASQRSLHNAPIFRLLLKVAVNGTHQCDFLNFCGGSGSQQHLLPYLSHSLLLLVLLSNQSPSHPIDMKVLWLAVKPPSSVGWTRALAGWRCLLGSTCLQWLNANWWPLPLKL